MNKEINKAKHAFSMENVERYIKELREIERQILLITRAEINSISVEEVPFINWAVARLPNMEGIKMTDNEILLERRRELARKAEKLSQWVKECLPY